jgi:hypothetical protein
VLFPVGGVQQIMRQFLKTVKRIGLLAILCLGGLRNGESLPDAVERPHKIGDFAWLVVWTLGGKTRRVSPLKSFTPRINALHRRPAGKVAIRGKWLATVAADRAFPCVVNLMAEGNELLSIVVASTKAVPASHDA